MTGANQEARRRRRRRLALACAAAPWAAACSVNAPRRSAPAAVPVATALPGPSSCPHVGQYWLRATGATYLVAELAGDTVATVAAPAAADGETSGAPSGAPSARGRIARVIRAGRTPAAAQPAGAPAASLDDAPEAVLVFWGSVGDCRPVALPPDVLGTQPGEHVFVSGMLRARDRWVGGRPTVDVYATPHLYVPSRERDHWAGTSDSIPAGAELMTADEYFAFYEGLPTRDDWDRHSTFARRRLRRWLRANAQLVAKEPAARMIRDMSAGRSRRY